MKLLPRLTAEFTGTAMLLAIVVGSGVMGERLANGNEALALLANSLATGFGLFALILVFTPVSGAHFNPLVTLAAWSRRNLPARTALGFAVAQTCGAVAGIMLAHAMFDLPLLSAGEKIRTGTGQWLAEATATFGLLLTIFGATRYGIPTLAGAVGSYIAAAYWFTASTSFANPAVTIARALTSTFAGIRPADVGFESLVGQVTERCRSGRDDAGATAIHGRRSDRQLAEGALDVRKIITGIAWVVRHRGERRHA